MNIKLLTLIALLAFVPCIVFVGEVSAEPALARSNGADATIVRFVKQHCVHCHGPDDQNGELRLDTLDTNLVSGADAERWNRVRTRLLAGEMPPEDEPRPAAADLNHAVAWLTNGLAKNPKITLIRPPGIDLPQYANRVDHQALFDPEPGTVAGAPRRLWRLNQDGYIEIVRDLAGDGAGNGDKSPIIQPFAGGAGDPFADYSTLLLIDEPTTEQLFRNSDEVAEFQSTASNRTGRLRARPTRQFIDLTEETSKPSGEQMEAAIRHQFTLVLRREPKPEELASFVALMRKNIQDGGQALGVRSTLATVLMLPEAMYRFELGDGRTDEHGRTRLAPREIAYAVAFALTDLRPDDDLLAAADKGELATRAGVAEQVERLLYDDSIAKPRILRFFREYFGYHLAPEVFKDDADFRGHDAELLVDDTDRLVQYILDEDKNVLVELLTTTKSFVGAAQIPRARVPKKPVYLAYNLEARPEDQPVDLPDDQRAGILTQPSWLVAFSENANNHAILRGKWVRERLLGGVIPDLPITVNAMLPEDKDKTLRERMAVTRESYCWQCHQKMNPLGLPFEMYDHFGRWRDTELGEPVDATGSIDFSGEPELDAPVKDSIELIKRLAGSDRVRQVFVRHAFRYWMGRNETLEDGPTLVAADTAYVESGGSMKALIVSLLTSDSFLHRRN